MGRRRRARALAWMGVAIIASLASISGCKHASPDNTPKIQWQFRADSQIVSTPALADDGTIYFTSKTLLYALAPDGGKKWQYFPGAEIHSSPVIGPDGTIHFGDTSGVVHAVNPDGSKRWIASVGPVVATPALFSKELLLVGESSGVIFALDPASGKTLYRMTSLSVSGSPEIPPTGRMIEGGGALQSFDAGGNIIWTQRLSSGRNTLNFRTAAMTNDGTIVAAGWDFNLHVFDMRGKAKWELSGDWLVNPVIAADGTIYTGDSSSVIALGPDGAKLWTAPIPGPGAPALADDGTIYVPGALVVPGAGSFHWALYALTAGGTVKWHVEVDARISNGPTIAPDGTIYFGTDSTGLIGPKPNSGTLYAIRENNGGLMKGGWPKAYGNAANDGHTPSIQ
jgi:outer membrane protein assembly factor BamB